MSAAQRASALIGQRFRWQGRGGAEGIDCVGVVLWAHRLTRADIPDDYRLSGDHRAAIEAVLERAFRPVPDAVPGDVLIMRVAHRQWHLGVAVAGGFVHADARAGRVMKMTGDPPWPWWAWRRKGA